jgi:dolichol-phosphate mannosyltransferase
MKIFATLPTYNESANIATLIAAIHEQNDSINIVVADDDSPDKTWQIVERVAREDPRVFLLRRTANKGRGAAGIDAFLFALDHQADVVIEMDADLSHEPRFIPAFLSKIKQFDVVIGSRAIHQGQDLRPSALRKALTTFSSLYARTLLGFPVKDCNSGYRCFRRRVLEAVDLRSFQSIGPSIVQELLYKAYLHNFSICEIPITFKEREAGQSNLNFGRLLDGFLMVLKLKQQHLAGKF